MPELMLQYFYAGRWSNTLITQPLEHVSVTKRAKRFAGQVFPNLAYELLQRWRGRHFRAGISLEGARGAVYHEPNFLPFKTNLPTVVTIHDLSILRYPETHPKDRVAFMSKRIVKAIHRADCLITDAEYIRQEILAEFNVDPERVVSVPLAAASHYRPVAAKHLPPVLNEFDLQPGQYILAVGTLEPRKNLMTAFRAYARLPERIRRSFPFVVAGMKGWGREGGNPEIECLVSRGEIRRLGYVSDEALPALYSGATLFVYPSLYEGFGLPPLEAMACGTPVIVSDRSTLPEVVGDAGLCVDAMDVDGLAEAMLGVIEYQDLRASLKVRGLARAAGFSWRRCAEQTLDVYHKVTAS